MQFDVKPVEIGGEGGQGTVAESAADRNTRLTAFGEKSCTIRRLGELACA